MSIARYAGALVAPAILAVQILGAHAEAERIDVGALTTQCRWLITKFDHHVKEAPHAASRQAWKLRDQGADECFGEHSAAYTMKDGVADLARALRAIGVDAPRSPQMN